MLSSLFLGMVCLFILDDDVIWLQQLHDLFPLLSVYDYASVHCPVLLQFPSTCYITVHNSLSLSPGFLTLERLPGTLRTTR